MPSAIPTIDEVLVAGTLANVTVTTAQAHAIVDTIARFEGPQTECLGLKSWHIPSPDRGVAGHPRRADGEAFVEVHFHYLPADIEVRPLGLEVTLFNPDGTVLSSQDFG